MPDCRFFTGAIKSSRGGNCFSAPDDRFFSTWTFELLAGVSSFACAGSQFSGFSLAGAGAAPFKFLAPHHLPDNGLLDFRAWLCLLPSGTGLILLAYILSWSRAWNIPQAVRLLPLVCICLLLRQRADNLLCPFIFFSLNCGVFSLRSPSALICGILKNFSSIQKSAMREGVLRGKMAQVLRIVPSCNGASPLDPQWRSALRFSHPKGKSAGKAWKAKGKGSSRTAERTWVSARVTRAEKIAAQKSGGAGRNIPEWISEAQFSWRKTASRAHGFKKSWWNCGALAVCWNTIFPWCASAMRHLICGQRWIVALRNCSSWWKNQQIISW